jgi:alkyl hydroperoxide reductase subunit F
MIYDLAIVGAGPAGMTAGVYAARKKLKTILLSKDIGGQAAWSSDIENYLGFTMIPGADLVAKFEHHLEKFKDDVELRILSGGVSGIKRSGKHFVVEADGKGISAKAVVITGGKLPRKLGIPGEDAYLNKGVTYCAWCDGPIFAGKEVAVIGGGNAALDAAINIAKIVKHIYLINLTEDLTGDPVMVDKVRDLHNVRIMNNMETVSFGGSKFLEYVEVLDTTSGIKKKVHVAGAFVEVGSVPATDYLQGYLELNKAGEIVIDKYNMTSVEGVFAAGDITDVVEKQVIVAAGEGAKAAIQASQYLSKLKD